MTYAGPSVKWCVWVNIRNWTCLVLVLILNDVFESTYGSDYDLCWSEYEMTCLSQHTDVNITCWVPGRRAEKWNEQVALATNVCGENLVTYICAVQRESVEGEGQQVAAQGLVRPGVVQWCGHVRWPVHEHHFMNFLQLFYTNFKSINSSMYTTEPHFLRWSLMCIQHICF